MKVKLITQHIETSITSVTYCAATRAGKKPMFRVLESWRRTLLGPSTAHPLWSLCRRLNCLNNVKTLAGAFNKENPLVGAFSVIVKTSRRFVCSSIVLGCTRLVLRRKCCHISSGSPLSGTWCGAMAQFSAVFSQYVLTQVHDQTFKIRWTQYWGPVLYIYYQINKLALLWCEWPFRHV